METKRWMTVAEVAQALQLSEYTIRKQIRADKVPARQFGGSWRIPSWWLEESPAPVGEASEGAE